MAQECGFFNAQLVGENEYDRVYLAEQFAAYFASFIGNGVFGKSMQKLEVLAQSSPNMSIKVLSGEAWINGWWYRNTDEYTLSLDIADGVLSRIDLVVLRWGNQERDIWLHVIKGTASYNPVAPSIRRDADYYDLQLAEISISRGIIKITQSLINDTRLNTNVCGLVTGVVDQIDTTGLYNQFEQYFAEFKAHYEKDYADWTAAQKAEYNRWATEKQNDYIQFVDISEKNYNDYIIDKKDAYDTFVLQMEDDYTTWTAAQKAEYRDWYTTNTTAWTIEFTAWFASIQDKLSGDIAGSLQLQIDDLDERLANIELQIFGVPIVTDDGKYIITSEGAMIGALRSAIGGGTDCSCEAETEDIDFSKYFEENKLVV